MRSKQWQWIAPLSVALVLLPVLAFAGQVSVPNQFANGDVADANDVNANFAALANAVNDNDTRLARVEGTAVLHVPHIAGDDAASGQALIAAVNAVPTDPLIDSYRIQLEPGVYDVGTTFLALPDALALCGAGRERSIIHSTAGDAVFLDNGASVEICDLTLRCRPATGGRGIRFSVPADLVLRHMRVDLIATISTGILGVGGTIDMLDTEVLAESTAAVSSTSGIELGTLSPTGPETELKACCCLISAVGTGTPRAVFVHRGVAQLTTTTVLAPGGEGVRLGPNADAGDIVKMRNGRVSAAVAMSAQQPGTLIQAACSQVEGTRLGNVTLVHCDDENFVAIP